MMHHLIYTGATSVKFSFGKMADGSYSTFILGQFLQVRLSVYVFKNFESEEAETHLSAVQAQSAAAWKCKFFAKRMNVASEGLHLGGSLVKQKNVIEANRSEEVLMRGSFWIQSWRSQLNQNRQIGPTVTGSIMGG